MTYNASIRFPNLGIEIESLNKSISIFGFDIAFYGIIIACGMIAGLVIACLEAKRTKQDPDTYLEFGIYAIISAIVGARLYFVIFDWDNYQNNLLQIFNIRAGGLAIYGGIIGAVICLLVFTKFKKLNFALMADTACLGLIAGQIIGRWGNFVNREAFGGYTSGLFAMQIKVSEAYYTTPELLEQSVFVDGIEYLQVHPTFLYESLWNLIVLILLLLYRKRKKFDGEVFLLYVLGYSIGRFWIEGLRTDQLISGLLGLPISQVLAAALAWLSVGMIIFLRILINKKK